MVPKSVDSLAPTLLSVTLSHSTARPTLAPLASLLLGLPALLTLSAPLTCAVFALTVDPFAHSYAEARVPVVGEAYGLLFRFYPPAKIWGAPGCDAARNSVCHMYKALYFVKPLVFIAFLALGVFLGTILHRKLLSVRLEMFADGKGTWFVSTLTSILTLFVGAMIVNLIVYKGLPTGTQLTGENAIWEGGDKKDLMISPNVGVLQNSLSQACAFLTFAGDATTAFMLIDMMLQGGPTSHGTSSRYSGWAPSRCRSCWSNAGGGAVRIAAFWVVLAVALGVSSLVFVVEGAEYGGGKKAWDNVMNSLKLDSTEVTRCVLAGFIVMLDLLVVFQDWDYPHFTHLEGVKMPGCTTGRPVWRACGFGGGGSDGGAEKREGKEADELEKLLEKKEAAGEGGKDAGAKKKKESGGLAWSYKWCVYGWVILILFIVSETIRVHV